MERDIPVEQILVVTYTVAATEELRERIRDAAGAALAALRGSAVTDEMAAELTAAVRRSAEAATRRVQQALANFDLAAIHTIHGFCQRALVGRRLRERPAVRPRARAGRARSRAGGRRRLLAHPGRRRTGAVRAASARPADHARDRWRRASPCTSARPDLTVVRPDAVPDDLPALEAACLEAWDAAPRAVAGGAGGGRGAAARAGSQQAALSDRSVTTWLRRMDGYLRVELPGLRGFEQLTKFTGGHARRVLEEELRCRARTTCSRAVETFARALRRASAAAVQRRLRATEDRPPARGARRAGAAQAPASACNRSTTCCSSCAARSTAPRGPALGGAPAPALDGGAGRRVPGHRSGTVPDRAAHLGRQRPAGVPGRRPEAGDLPLPRRRHLRVSRGAPATRTRATT